MSIAMAYADCRELELDVTLSSFSDEHMRRGDRLCKRIDLLRIPVMRWSSQRQKARAVVGHPRRRHPLRDRPSWCTGQQHVFRLKVLDIGRRKPSGALQRQPPPTRRRDVRGDELRHDCRTRARGRQGRDLMYLICSVPSRGMRGLAPLRA